MEILQFLQDQLMYDYKVFTENFWLYYWAMVPAIGYLCFFVVKWTVLTLPFWLPICLALSVLSNSNTVQVEGNNKNKEQEE